MAPRSFRTRLVAGLLCGLLLAPSFAFAATTDAVLDQAKQQIAEAEFDEALKTINGALARPDNSDETVTTLYQLQGLTYMYLGREPSARQAFERLLQVSPDYELPKGTSAKVRSLFDSVRAEMKPKPAAVTVSHTPPSELRAGEPAEFTAKISGLPDDGRARLFFRRPGTNAFSSADFAVDGGGAAKAQVAGFELPADKTEWELEYYLEAQDGGGKRLAGAGTSDAPLKAHVAAAGSTVAPVADEAIYQKWWFWTLVGVGAAGVGTAVAVPLLSEKRASLPVTVKVDQ